MGFYLHYNKGLKILIDTLSLLTSLTDITTKGLDMIDYLGGKLCKNPLYMDAVCKTLPIHITNVLRVSLNVLSSLAGDK